MADKLAQDGGRPRAKSRRADAGSTLSSALLHPQMPLALCGERRRATWSHAVLSSMSTSIDEHGLRRRCSMDWNWGQFAMSASSSLESLVQMGCQ